MNQLQPTANKPPQKRWLFLAGLAVIFVGPLVAALGLYNFRSFVPETMSYGHLILPPLSLNKLPLTDGVGGAITAQNFRGEWLLMYVAPKLCNKLCQDNLYKIRQVRKALGKEMNRVQRVVLTLQGQSTKSLQQAIAQQYQGTIHIITKRNQLQKFFNGLPSERMALATGYLYVVDPHGNVMMSYQPKQPPRGIYKDLKRLLKASRIG